MIILCFECGVYGNEVRILFFFVESVIFDSILEIVKNVYIVVKVICEVCLILVDSEEVFYNEVNFDV